MCDLEYTDDMALLSDNWEDLTAMLSSLATYCKTLGLTISCKKTKDLAILPSESHHLPEPIQFSPSDDTIEVVSHFQYLESVIQDNCKSNLKLTQKYARPLLHSIR